MRTIDAFRSDDSEGTHPSHKSIRGRKVRIRCQDLTSLCVVALIWLGGAVAGFCSPTASDSRYAATDLGALAIFPQSDWSSPTAVNYAGQVAVNTHNGGQAYATVACLWDKGQTQRITGFPPLAGSSLSDATFPVDTAGPHPNTFPTGPWSEASGLNNHGQVVGSYYTSVSPWSRAFIFEKGHMTLLAAPTGADAQANSINDAGQIVGRVDLHDGSRHPYLWTHQKPSELPTLGGKYGEAHAINAAGVIVGESSLADGSLHAVMWERGQVRDINPLGFKGSEATGINDRGQIVGNMTLPDGSHHACIWMDGKASDLGTLGGKNSEAKGINSMGQVVGDADIGIKVEGYNTVTHAFIWDTKKGLRDLNILLSIPALSATAKYDLWGASGINNKGQIVASHLFGHALLLTPVLKN